MRCAASDVLQKLLEKWRLVCCEGADIRRVSFLSRHAVPRRGGLQRFSLCFSALSFRSSVSSVSSASPAKEIALSLTARSICHRALTLPSQPEPVRSLNVSEFGRVPSQKEPCEHSVVM